MEIYPEMVKDAIKRIILGSGGDAEHAATLLTYHAYSFAELPAPIFGHYDEKR